MLNHITLMGRLVSAPELRVTGSGTKVAALRIACDRDYTPEGAEKQCDFFDAVAWRQTGEFVCRNFTKGQPILVSGRLQTRKWQDRDGKNRIAYEIIVESAYFAGGERRNTAAEAKKPEIVELGDDDSELPWGDEL